MALNEIFGTHEGQQVHKYILKNKNNLSVEILNLGGIIRALWVPDQAGQLADVVNGFDNVEDYFTKSRYFGALIGRFSNRIANGQFALNRQTYSLAVNNGPNHLHGGIKGFDKYLWDVEATVNNGLTLHRTSPDGEEGYPGELDIKVEYHLTHENELVIDYTATTSSTTIVNLTNHTYFNLAGHDAGSIYEHTVMINASHYTPKDSTNIPIGEIASVKGTVFDLQTPTLLGDVILNVPEDLGFDHNFCVDGEPGNKNFVCRVEDGASGRVMEVYSTQPGVQFYTANYLTGQKGKNGAVYGKHSSFCLETQNYPDAINKDNFPSCVLQPGDLYHHTTVYKFPKQSESNP